MALALPAACAGFNKGFSIGSGCRRCLVAGTGFGIPGRRIPPRGHDGPPEKPGGMISAGSPASDLTKNLSGFR